MSCWLTQVLFEFLCTLVLTELLNLLIRLGDQMQGTLFFKYFKAGIIVDWMNRVGYDLMVTQCEVG